MRMMIDRDRRVPGLNTSSLPDLIFTVLFFFMIVTHMREVELKVEYRVPQGTELERLTRKSTVSNIYIGRPIDSHGGTSTSEIPMQDSVAIQMNDKFVAPSEIAAFITSERKSMSPDDVSRLTISIAADRNVKMGVITDIKQILRQSNALNIIYSAENREK